LSRVIKRLGEVTTINPRVIENLYAGDLAFLQDLYARVNHIGHSRLAVTCPHCEQAFEVEAAAMGE
jgi:hypothetical protein